MQYNRAILLASTALVGLGALGFSSERSFATTCTAGGSVLTCKDPGTSAEVNAAIVAQPGPDLGVVFDATTKIDTATGNVLINGQAQFTGTVSYTNNGQIGLETGGLPNNNDKGLQIVGKNDVATNNATITNNSKVYGLLDIGSFFPAGGTATVVSNGLVTGSVTVRSAGNATLTTNAAGNIWGPIFVQSFNGVKTQTNTPSTSFTTTTEIGANAIVNLGADVGKLTDPSKAENATTNPFLPSTITIDSVALSALTLQARSGNATLTSFQTQNVFGTNVSAPDGAGNVTTITKANQTFLQGTSAANITATGQVLGVLNVKGVTSAVVNVDGVVGTGAGTVLILNGEYAATTNETTTVVNSGGKTTSITNVTKTADLASASALTVGATGLVDGQVTITNNGDSTLTVNGSIGRVKSDGTVVNGTTAVELKANTLTDTKVTTNDATGKQTGFVETITNIDSGGNFTGTIGAAGLINGQLTVMNGGNFNLTVNGKIGNAAVSGTALNVIAWKGNDGGFSNDRTFTDTKTFDPATGLQTKEVSTDLRTASGGAATLTVAAGAAITGSVTVRSDQALKFTNNGSIVGDTLLNTSRGLQTNSSFSTENSTKTVGTTTTKVNNNSTTSVNATVGSSIAADNNSLTSILGNFTATALGDVVFNDPGFISGNVTLQSNGNTVVATTTNNSTNVVAQVDPADATKGFTDTTTTVVGSTNSNTMTGGSVTGTYAGIVGIDNTTVGAFPVGVVPGTATIQAANKVSTATISGKIFEKVSSFGGAVSTTGTVGANTTSSSSTTSVETKNLDAAKVLLSGTRTDTTVAASDSTVPTGSSSVVTITGQVLKNAAGAVSPVVSQAPGGATVTVNGGLVEGAVTASTANVANTKSSNNATFTYSIDKNGKYNETAASGGDSSTQTGVGGAALVTITGSGSRVTGLVTAQGTSGATVTVDATGRADSGVTVGIVVPNDVSDVNAGARVYSDAKNFTQTETEVFSSAPAAVSGNALATLNGKVAGAVNVSSTTGSATATVNVSTANLITDVNVSALGTRQDFSDKDVRTGTTLPTALPSGQPSGAVLQSTYDSTNKFTSVGGAATANLTAVAGISGGLASDLLVKGNISITGDKSATLTVGAGSRVGTVGSFNTISLTSTPTLSSTTLSQTFVKGVLDTQKTVSESHFTGGTATATNAGELRVASLSLNAGTSTTLTNSGRVGIFGVPIAGSPPISGFPRPATISLNALQTDSITTVTSSGGATNLGIGTSSTTVDQRIPIGGTALLDNTGFLFGQTSVAAGTGTVNNKAGAALGQIGSGALTFGPSALLNYTSTTITTPTSTTGPTVVVPTTLFAQNYTLNQSGLLVGDIFVRGALGDSVTGTTKTSAVTATLNLNNASVTAGGINSQVSGSANTAQTTINVNLNDTGFLGFAPAAFNVLPSLSGTQLEFMNLSPTSLAPGASLSSLPYIPGTIRHAAAVVKSGAGTFYLVGSGLQTFGTPTTADDLYDLQATSFTINQGGEVQFIVPEAQVYGIGSAVTNNGSFVYGARRSFTPLPNLTTNLLSTQNLVNGIAFQVDGSFTQSATGKSVVTVLPGLIRVQPFVTTPVASELVGLPTGVVAVPLFTTPTAFFGPAGPNKSSMFINGNLTLGGTVEALTVQQGLYTAGTTLPIWTVTGTVTLNSPTVTTVNSSPFVTFSVQTSKVGSNTVVSLVTGRNSFSTVAHNENATNVGTALDADLTSVVSRITRDANGEHVFNTIQEFRDAQDLANILSAMDFVLSPTQSSKILNEMSSQGVYGSVLAIDRTRSLSSSIDGAINEASLTTMPGTTFWITPTFRSTHLNSSEDRGAQGIRSNEVGATMGGEWRMDRFGIGLAGGYGSERLSRGLTGDIETWMAGVYGYYVDGPIHVGAQITYGNSNYDTDRALPTLFRTAGADFNGHSTAGKLEGGYSWPVMGTRGTITPFAAIEFRKVVTQGFTETGAGGVNLIVERKDESITSPQVGVRWAGTMFGTTLYSLVPELEASYTFMGDLNTDSDVMLAAGVTPISVRGVETDGFATVRAGLFGGIGANGSIGVTGSMDFGSSQTSSSISAVLRLLLQ